MGKNKKGKFYGIEIAIWLNGKKEIMEAELKAKFKMGKSLYLKSSISKGHLLSREDISIKSPAGGLEPYHLYKVIGKKLKTDLPQESMLLPEHLE